MTQLDRQDGDGLLERARRIAHDLSDGNRERYNKIRDRLTIELSDSGAPQPRGEPPQTNATQPGGSPNIVRLAERIVDTCRECRLGKTQASVDYNFDNSRAQCIKFVTDTISNLGTEVASSNGAEGAADALNQVRAIILSLPSAPVSESDEVLAQQIHEAAGCHVKSERTKNLIAWYRTKQSAAPVSGRDAMLRGQIEECLREYFAAPSIIFTQCTNALFALTNHKESGTDSLLPKVTATPEGTDDVGLQREPSNGR